MKSGWLPTDRVKPEGFSLKKEPFGEPFNGPFSKEVITLYSDQESLCEVYVNGSSSNGHVFRAMLATLVNAIEVLHPRLPEDFFKDFSG